jgi:hypothetical protein
MAGFGASTSLGPTIEMAGFGSVVDDEPVIEMAGSAPSPGSEPGIEMAGFARNCRYLPTVSRSIPSSRAIRHRDQPRSAKL